MKQRVRIWLIWLHLHPSSFLLPGVHSGSKPACQPHGAVRVEGDGVPLARLAALVMVRQNARRTWCEGRSCAGTLLDQGKRVPVQQIPWGGHHPGAEMKSTGEVMGIDDTMAMAFAKAQMAAQFAAANVWHGVHSRSPTAIRKRCAHRPRLRRTWLQAGSRRAAHGTLSGGTRRGRWKTCRRSRRGGRTCSTT